MRLNSKKIVGGGRCCLSACYECSCNPLYCGAFDIQLQAGVAPITWRNRGTAQAVSCANFPLAPVVPAFNIPSFKTFFKTPWTVGGQLGYAVSDNGRVYIEFNYVQANKKDDQAFAVFNSNESIALALTKKYSLYDFYVGARYYFDRWCDRTSLFIGGKIGVTHHRAIEFGASITNNDCSGLVSMIAPNTSLFTKSTVVSGGANIGLDFCFCGNFSFVITGEVVANCGPRGNRNIPLIVNANSIAATNLLWGHIQTELQFPVTAAIRYSF